MFFFSIGLIDLVLGVELSDYVRKNVHDFCDVTGFFKKVRFVSLY